MNGVYFKCNSLHFKVLSIHNYLYFGANVQTTNPKNKATARRAKCENEQRKNCNSNGGRRWSKGDEGGADWVARRRGSGGLKGGRQMQIPRYRYKRAQIQSNTYVNCFAASVVGVAKNEKLLFKIKSTFNFLVICCQPAQPQKEKGGRLTFVRLFKGRGGLAVGKSRVAAEGKLTHFSTN